MVMNISILRPWLLASIFIANMLIVSSSHSAVPAPPVIQQQGIPDHYFYTMSEPVCRACHNQNPPPGIAVDPTFLANRHHLKIGQAIQAKTDIQYPDADNDGIDDTVYTCPNCHELIFDEVTNTFQISDLSNCMLCHVYSVEGSVHHRSEKTVTLDCKACHGGLVNNHPTAGSNPDGHYIPTYSPSRLTPWPSGKPSSGNGETPSSAGTYPGNCDYCHNTEDGTAGGGTPEPTQIGLLMIDKNEYTHHSAAAGSLEYPGQPPCMVCHNFTSSPEYAIRTCENCHGVDTLHSISADTNGNGFKILREAPGYSHVGARSDCWGCHGNNPMMNVNSLTVRQLPRIDALSNSNISAGVDALLMIEGSDFIGYKLNPVTGANNLMVTSIVLLTDDDGNLIELDPMRKGMNSIDVVIPGSIQPGNYRIVVKKEDVESNPMSFVVKPKVEIQSAVCTGERLIVSGSGFGGYSIADNSGTSVTVSGESGKVISWSGNEIHAQAMGCGSGKSVVVNSVYGSASSTIE